ncbi:MAG: hypothetical protein RL375_3736 [Pseudomonadota bacterium]|jgi:hypothetical protein
MPHLHPPTRRQSAGHSAVATLLAVTALTLAGAPARAADAAAHTGHGASAPAGHAQHQHHQHSHPAPPAAAARQPKGDLPAIRHVLMATFDKPEARLSVDPVVVVGTHAVAGWSQGERGGRALMRRGADGWQIVLCAGDGLKQASVLRDAGIDGPSADRLARELASAESRLSADQRARFASFEGVVKMDAHGNHPPAHK